MPDGIVAELAVSDPGDCPAAAASADTAAVTSVSRAQATAADGTAAEDLALPAGATPDDPSFEPVASFADRDLYRFRREKGEPCVCEAVERVAGPVTDVTARDGTLSVTVRTSDPATVRDAVSTLQSQFDGVRVSRLRRAGDGDEGALVLVDRAELTDRQQEVLETAHEMGYFAYPKDANAGEVADAIGVSPSTFSEHLAAAQSKLMDAILTE